MAPTSQQTLAKQLASESDQLTLISCTNVQQKIASEPFMKVYTSLAQRRSNFLEQLLTQVVICHNGETDSEDKFLKFNHYVTTFNTYFCIYFVRSLSFYLFSSPFLSSFFSRFFLLFLFLIFAHFFSFPLFISLSRFFSLSSLIFFRFLSCNSHLLSFLSFYYLFSPFLIFSPFSRFLSFPYPFPLFSPLFPLF